MKLMSLIRVAICCGATLLLGAHAVSAATLPPITQLHVIHDTGTGIPVQAFVSTALKRLDDANNQVSPMEPVTETPSMEQLLRLPLHSVLTPGVQPHVALPEDIRKGMTQAMFIVGADAASEAWLSRHEEWLFQRNAVGYLVQAETLADVDRMLGTAGRLPMTVVNLDLLAKEFSISHYPLLITREGVFHDASSLEQLRAAE